MPDDNPHRVAPVAYRVLPANLVQERGGVTVWWSNISRKGDWVLPRLFRIFTFMGNVELDLASARIPEGECEIEIKCIMANVEISAPADIRMICDGDGILGNFEIVKVGEVAPPPVDAPTVRVTGTAYMGSVTIKVMGVVGPGWKDRLKAWTAVNG